MRYKLFVTIICIIALSIGFGSCMKSEEENTEYSISTIVTDFTLDTINGVKYTFSIDQLNHIIFNKDSMPVASDTALKQVYIKTFNTSGFLVSGLADSLVLISNPMDLRHAATSDAGMTFKVISGDRMTSQTYTLRINVHKQDPELLAWTKIEGHSADFSAADFTTGIKTCVFKNELLVFNMLSDKSILVSHSDISNPTKCVLSSVLTAGLPADIEISSVTPFRDRLYAVTESGTVYSSTDALNWMIAPELGNNVQSLLAGFSDKLTAVISDNGKDYFAFTGTSEMKWIKGEEKPSGFPTYNICPITYLSDTGAEHAILTGMPGNAISTVPWMSIDGTVWGEMSTNTEYSCPIMDNPSILYFDKKYYAFGSGLDSVYVSKGGLIWSKSDEKFMLPTEINGHNTYSATVDQADFIWMVVGGNAGEPNTLWRGRINKYGFLRQ